MSGLIYSLPPISIDTLRPIYLDEDDDGFSLLHGFVDPIECLGLLTQGGVNPSD
jgi:hypothetical protein